ncbi:MAG TPA: hypothetical protein VFD57_05800, partial [Clostridia bacterium]|nr:hypothetical protein [Clostridia bacterium]
AIVVLIAVGSAFVYADNPIVNRFRPVKSEDEDFQEWHKDRVENRKQGLEEALEEGIITEKEAKTWEEHFDYMDKFHQENGYMRGGFGCHEGKSGGMMRRHRRGL